MVIPFYADSEKLSEDDSPWAVLVFILYIILNIVAFTLLEYFDHTSSKILKILLAILIVGFPGVIIAMGKRNIWRHGDEFLQSLYLKHTAYNGVAFLFILILWQLWGRITDQNMWDNLAISMAPYLLIYFIFNAVRRDIKKP